MKRELDEANQQGPLGSLNNHDHQAPVLLHLDLQDIPFWNDLHDR